MTRTLRILAVAAVLCLAGPASAQDGKASLTKLFNDAAATAAGSTVRIRLDSKDAALGTIVDAKGLILTKGSEIVVKGAEKPFEPKGTVSIRLRDGSEYDVELLGYHEATDLALLKIDAADLVAVKFVAAKIAEAGNMVAAPGLETEPLAAGIVSAGLRKLVREEALIENGNKGYLGIRLGSNEDDGGVVIGGMDDGSPAKKAKLLVGDTIVKVADKSIGKFDDLKAALDRYKPGDKVKVFVKRKTKDSDDEEELSFDVKLGSKGDFDRGAMQNRMGSQLSGRRTGFPQVITTDVIIKPSDCGGPLVDLEGRVLGINIARAGRVESWVLPSEVISPVLAELKAGKAKPKKASKE